MNKIKVILDDIAGGRDEDNDMTVGEYDMKPTKQRLTKLAIENGLETPFHFIILPKKIKLFNYGSQYEMSRMMLVDKNNKAIRTGELTWEVI